MRPRGLGLSIALLAGLCLPAAAVEALVHPGLMNSQAELDFWISKVAASQQPWLTAYNNIPDFSGYTPKLPSSPNMDADGDIQLRDDCLAAYGSTLQWFRTGTAARATKAKQILNHMPDTVTGSSGGKLWWGYYVGICVWAAELLKHATPDAGWSTADEDAYKNWLVNFVNPRLQTTDIAAGSSGGTSARNNWATVAAASRLAIGVFADNQTLYNQGLTDLRTLIRFYIGCQFAMPNGGTVNSCGSVPASFNFELCRLGNSGMGGLTGGDLHHAQFGFSGLVYGAEVAKHQGVDLFGYKHTTTPPTPSDNMGIEDGLLYIDQFVGFNQGRSGSTSSGWPCAETLASNDTDVQDFWPVAGNHYGNSGQIDDVALHHRSQIIGSRHFQLTHNYGNVGGGGSPTPDTTPPSVPTGLTVQRDSDT
jgi:hypothetical protein